MAYYVVLFSQHLKLDSLGNALSDLPKEGNYIILTTHLLFANEKEQIKKIFSNAIFLCFADLLSDENMANCDKESDLPTNVSIGQYYAVIKENKNALVLKHLKEKYDIERGIILSDDLGIDEGVWKRAGFKRRDGEYHWKEKKRVARTSIYSRIKTALAFFGRESHIAKYNGKRYVFYGRLNRVGYRLTLDFKPSRFEGFMFGLERLCIKLFKSNGFKRDITRMTTFHEFKALGEQTPLKVLQDGYLPPNYSSCYMHYYTGDIEFYAWDKMSCQTFEHHHLPHRIIPFRKKLFLPEAHFPARVKKVLCVTSGAGDWTAVKNRSDEDAMIETFVEVARRCPDIEFVYRCHPVWIIPQHQGVNSIHRVAEYFDTLGLPNLKLSSNIPPAFQDGKMVLSYQRTSLEEDLKDVDVIFGEHSISMIDGAFKGIVFSSVNTTGRRNFFQGITDLGFPHCESVDEIAAMLESVNTSEFQESYNRAIQNYNKMTEQD